LLRNNPGGQKYLARLEHKHGKGKALTILAHTLARAIYYMLQRRGACDLDAFLHREGRSAGEPAAELGPHGWRLPTVLGHKAPRASTHAPQHIGPLPGPCAVDWMPALAPVHRVNGPDGHRVLPLPRTCAELAHTNVQPGVCVGRYEGTDMFRGRREPYVCSL
jgi:hypothetical protein